MIKRPEIIDLAVEGRLHAMLAYVESPDFSKSNCIGVPTDLFFDDDQSSVARAKQVCNACPIMNQCGEWAAANTESGVFGGLTAAERVQKFGAPFGHVVPSRLELAAQLAFVLRAPAREVAHRYAATQRTVVRWRTILRAMEGAA